MTLCKRWFKVFHAKIDKKIEIANLWSKKMAVHSLISTPFQPSAMKVLIVVITKSAEKKRNSHGKLEKNDYFCPPYELIAPSDSPWGERLSVRWVFPPQGG